MKNIIVLILIGFLSSIKLLASTYQIKHLEPANWWVGMDNPNLQLLVHGDNISELTPKVNSQFVKLLKTNTTDNPNYLFVDLLIAKDAKAETFELSFVKNGKVELTTKYQLAERVNGSAERQGFSPKDVIYLVTPDRFVNGDLTNDEVASMKEGLNRSHPGGRHGGDIQGIINSIDYIESMGYTQLWLNPVLENNMETYSYHGYSTTDYYQVDPRYGSNELYIELSQRAKQKGIGLIKDIILNHIGSEHWWMKDKPAKDWINHDGNFVGTTHLREALHDPYAPESSKLSHADGWFVPTMPDLNQRNAYLSTYLIQNSIWWIETAGLSGVRLDTYSYPDKAFLADWNDKILAEYPNLNIVGEEWTSNAAYTAYWQAGSKRHDDYESKLPSVFDFSIQTSLVEALNETESWGKGLIKLYHSLANDFLYGNPYNLVTFPDNHDMTRIHSSLNEDAELTKIALTFIATTRGIPQIYYGTEVLMTAVDDHGLIRSDFAGGWPGDKTSVFTGQGLTTEQKDMLSYSKALFNWRKGSDLIANGKLMHFPPKEGVYVYFRYSEQQPGKVLMMVLNKNDSAVTIDLTDYKELLTAKEYKVLKALSGKKINTKNVPVSAKRLEIFELSK